MARFRLSAYDIHARAASPVAVPGTAFRFFYVRDGAVLIRSAGRGGPVAPDSGVFAEGEAVVEGTGTVWMFELSSAPVQFSIGPSVWLLRSHALDGAVRGERIMRADRIQSPPGSVTPPHRHRGPGIRRLLHGRLMAEVGDRIERIEAGDSWFESGDEPVVGTNVNDADNAFVRVMVLPAELKGGRTSFIPHTPEDALKPRAVEQRVFGELPVSL